MTKQGRRRNPHITKRPEAKSFFQVLEEGSGFVYLHRALTATKVNNPGLLGIRTGKQCMSNLKRYLACPLIACRFGCGCPSPAESLMLHEAVRLQPPHQGDAGASCMFVVIYRGFFFSLQRLSACIWLHGALLALSSHPPDSSFPNTPSRARCSSH